MDVKNVLFGSDSGSKAGEAGLLILRVFAGLSLALAHGIKKIPPPEMFTAGVAKIGFPLPEAFAWAASLSEFAGGILLALGLLTRPAALFILITMGVAAGLVHAADPFEKKEMALLYFFIASAYLFYGAGRYSIDRMIRGKPKA